MAECEEPGRPALQVLPVDSYAKPVPATATLPVLAASALGALTAWAATGSIAPALWMAAGIGPAAVGLLRLQRRQQQLEHSLHRAWAETRRSRLDPHFVLNAVSAALPDSPATDTLSRKLQAYFRYVHLHRDLEDVTLAEEFWFVQGLLQLEQARFGPVLAVSTRLDETAGSTRVPALLLQPLVENAVKYGHPDEDGRVHVSLAIERAGNVIEVTVTNTGEWRPEGEGGFGLELVRHLLASQWPRDHRLLATTRGGRVHLTLHFPATPTPILNPTAPP